MRQSPALLAFRRAAVRRAGGGGDANPVWGVPPKEYLKASFQPSIPDQHFYGAHYNYAPITMWLRQRRPTMEKVGGGVYDFVTGTAQSIWAPFGAHFDRQLPGIGCKVVGLMGGLLGISYVIAHVNEENEGRMFLEKMATYKTATELADKGFWKSHSEDTNDRVQAHNVDAIRLNALWEKALADATQDNSFDTMVAALETDLQPAEVPVPITWRFNMMPYGAGSGDTHTFPVPDHELPMSALHIMELGGYGDYIDRQDNKPNPIRKARHLYSGAFLPATK
jgi:hypothetical protein